MVPPESTEVDSFQFTREQWAFLRHMNHDLRTPLMTILGTCEMLADGTYGEASPKQQKALDRVLRNSRHLESLLTHAMTYIRLKSNALALHSDPIPIAEFLNDLLAEGRQRIADKPLTVGLVILAEMPATITGDSMYLAMIVRELITNSVNFTPAGKVVIQVVPDHDQWVLTVQDTGIGLASDDIGHVFDPFWRGQDAKTYAPQGDGLGLTVVKDLVYAMHGTLEIQSQPTAGCCVTVRLPQVIPSQNAPLTTNNS